MNITSLDGKEQIELLTLPEQSQQSIIEQHTVRVDKDLKLPVLRDALDIKFNDRRPEETIYELLPDWENEKAAPCEYPRGDLPAI
jgi:hypothetical protein